MLEEGFFFFFRRKEVAGFGRQRSKAKLESKYAIGKIHLPMRNRFAIEIAAEHCKSVLAMK